MVGEQGSGIEICTGDHEFLPPSFVCSSLPSHRKKQTKQNKEGVRVIEWIKNSAAQRYLPYSQSNFLKIRCDATSGRMCTSGE